MQDTSHRQTLAGVLTGLFAVITQAAISFFLTPYIVRVLGEEANGFAQLANNFVMYASLLTVAFNSMGGRFLAVSYHKGESGKTRRYYSSLVVCNIAITLLLLPLAAYVVADLEHIVNIETADVGDVKTLFLCVFLNFFINQFVALFSMSMYVRNRMFLQNIIQFVRTLLNALILLCAFSFLPPHIYFVSAAALILTVAVLPVCYAIRRRLLPGVDFSIRNFEWSSVKELLRSGVWNTVNQGGHMLMTGLDLLLANLFIDPISMGVLSVSKVIPSFITHLATTLNANLSPSVTISWARGGDKDALRELRRGMKLSSILVATPIVVFCGFGMEFYQLWTPTMDARQLTILSFLACASFIPMAGPQALYNIFTAANKLSVNAISFRVIGLLNVGIVYAVLSSGSKNGIYAIAGISALLAIVRNLVVTIPYTASILKLKWYEFYKDVGLSVLCCIIVFLIVLLVKKAAPVTGWLSLIVLAVLTSAAAVAAESFIILRREERRRLYDAVKSKLSAR